MENDVLQQMKIASKAISQAREHNKNTQHVVVSEGTRSYTMEKSKLGSWNNQHAQSYVEEIQRTQVEELNSWLNPLLQKPPTSKEKETSEVLDLNEMWDQQEKFMQLLQEKRGLPQYPVDLSTKQGQRIVKECVQDAVGELYESLFELKNTKMHRQTNVSELDREHFLEEVIDCFHYIVECAIFAGFTAKDFYEMYLRKGDINEQRIMGGY